MKTNKKLEKMRNKEFFKYIKHDKLNRAVMSINNPKESE
jgi:hypothetical protein